MVFIKTSPTPSERISDSQPILLGNNVQLDATYGSDHYAYTDGTVNNGRHNFITTPVATTTPLAPTTAADVCRFYALEQTTEIGILQYSRGPNDAVPTPVTNYQGPLAPETLGIGATIDILDFAGVKDFIAIVSATGRVGATLLSGSATISGNDTIPVYAVSNLGRLLGAANPIFISLRAQITPAGLLQFQNISGAVMDLVTYSIDFKRIVLP